MDQRHDSNPVTRPFAAIGQIRSAGIRDLRAGKLLSDADSASALSGLPLPAGVACFTVAVTTAAEPADGQPPLFKTLLANRSVGDGLVPMQSALGLHPAASKRLDFLPDRQKVVWQTGHIDLLHSGAVAAQLRD